MSPTLMRLPGLASEQKRGNMPGEVRRLAHIIGLPQSRLLASRQPFGFTQQKVEQGFQVGEDLHLLGVWVFEGRSPDALILDRRTMLLIILQPEAEHVGDESKPSLFH